MKREKRMTKRERKAVEGIGPSGTPRAATTTTTSAAGARPEPQLAPGSHLHCLSCGKHLDTVGEARERAAAGLKNTLWASVRCGHGSTFYACMEHIGQAKALLDEHDRTGGEVRAAAPWH